LYDVYITNLNFLHFVLFLRDAFRRLNFIIYLIESYY